MATMVSAQQSSLGKSLISVIKKILTLLSNSDRKKLFALSAVQVSLGFLDLLGVLGIGLLGSLSINNISGNSNNDFTKEVLSVLNLEMKSIQFQVSVIATASLLLLISRTVISIYFTRKILSFLAHRSAKVTAGLTSKLLSRSILDIKTRTYQENLFALTTGVQYLLIQVLATSLVIISDLSILFFILFGLLAVDPVLAFLVTSLFSLIGFTLYKLMNGEAQKLGKMSSSLKIENSEKIVEAIRFYRETFVHNKTEKYIDEIEKINLKYAAVSSKLNFMPYISKYVIETAIIIGSVLVSAVQFILHDLTSAVTTLSLFLAAGSRLAPAVLRVQQGFVSIRGGLGQAEPTLELINELETPVIEKVERSIHNRTDSAFSPHIKLSQVSMKYPTSFRSALVDVNFEIESGKHVAIVGPSGSGKSTLVDVLLGILTPTSGSVEISGVSPREAISNWPGKISFVPQDVFLTKGSIKENITIGYLPSEISTETWQEAIKSADLESFVDSLPKKAETKVGEDGALISGGQKQRIGIARALVSSPKLLVLDESTSSLDLQSESEISQSLLKLKGEVTIIMIAHRLISIKDADVIIYLDGGRVLSVGNFEKVKMEVPEFNLMAQKSGL